MPTTSRSTSTTAWCALRCSERTMMNWCWEEGSCRNRIFSYDLTIIQIMKKSMWKNFVECGQNLEPNRKAIASEQYIFVSTLHFSVRDNEDILKMAKTFRAQASSTTISSCPSPWWTWDWRRAVCPLLRLVFTTSHFVAGNVECKTNDVCSLKILNVRW